MKHTTRVTAIFGSKSKSVSQVSMFKTVLKASFTSKRLYFGYKNEQYKDCHGAMNPLFN